MKKLACLLAFVFMLFVCQAFAADPITAADAIKHIGEQQTVCGTVASTNYAPDKLKTYLNIDKPFPDQVFTAVIEGQVNHDAFKEQGTPDKVKDYYASKSICVSGTVILYKEKAQIMVTNPTQVKVN
jgi:hypothetical protein